MNNLPVRPSHESVQLTAKYPRLKNLNSSLPQIFGTLESQLFEDVITTGISKDRYAGSINIHNFNTPHIYLNKFREQSIHDSILEIMVASWEQLVAVYDQSEFFFGTSVSILDNSISLINTDLKQFHIDQGQFAIKEIKQFVNLMPTIIALTSNHQPTEWASGRFTMDYSKIFNQNYSDPINISYKFSPKQIMQAEPYQIALGGGMHRMPPNFQAGEIPRVTVRTFVTNKEDYYYFNDFGQ